MIFRQSPNESGPLTKNSMLFLVFLALNFKPSWLYINPSGLGDEARRIIMEYIAALDAGDDIVDNLGTTQITKLGSASLGTSKSEFLHNLEAIWPDAKRTAGIAAIGLATENERTAFLNLMCHYIAATSVKISVGDRAGAAEINWKLNAVHLSFLAHMLNRNHDYSISLDSLNFQDLEAAYPVTIIAARVLQLRDDLGDLFKDMSAEIKLGHPTPNAVLAKINSNEAESVIKKLAPCIIRISELPDPFKSAVQTVKEEYKTLTSRLPFHMRVLYNKALHYTLEHRYVINPRRETSEILWTEAARFSQPDSHQSRL